MTAVVGSHLGEACTRRGVSPGRSGLRSKRIRTGGEPPLSAGMLFEMQTASDRFDDCGGPRSG